jgi:hypothetical protein
LVACDHGPFGYLFIGPNAVDNPTSSTLNFRVGDDRANGVTVALGTGGILGVTMVGQTPTLETARAWQVHSAHTRRARSQ